MSVIDYSSFLTSVDHVPLDVLEQLIFRLLPVQSLVVCLLVSSRFKKLASRRIALEKDKLAYFGSIHMASLRQLCGSGWLSLLEWFQTRLHYPTFTKGSPQHVIRSCLNAAVQRGEKRFLAYALEVNRDIRNNYWICSSAAEGGHLDLLKWAYANGCQWNEETCWRAARGGHLTLLKWAVKLGCPFGYCATTAAAAGGHLKVLQWLHAKGCPWGASTCSAAAACGHMEILEWARASGCPWSVDTCAAAAEEGHLEILQWLRANGCEWDEYTCLSAARTGRLAVLQWAVANGCLMDVPQCLEYAIGGDVIDWLEAQQQQQQPQPQPEPEPQSP